jgi:hypothetical protein
MLLALSKSRERDVFPQLEQILKPFLNIPVWVRMYGRDRFSEPLVEAVSEAA